MTPALGTPVRDIEMAVVATILLEEDAFDQVRGVLEPQHFSDNAHALIFQACDGLSKADVAIDVVSVASWLRDRDCLQDVGTSYLAVLADVTPLEDIATYARVIRENACLPYPDLRGEVGTLRESLRLALNENAALLENLTATQTRCTELLEAQRSFDVDGDVRQLFQGYRQEIPETPCITPALAFRVDLIDEEHRELHESVERRDLVGIVDACIDIIVVTIGMLVACGVRFWPMWRLVHASNVAKFGGPRRADGKAMKPHDWSPPDVKQQLVAQGWREAA